LSATCLRVWSEPHAINAEAVQYSYRGYRIGQPNPVVYLNWLYHADSIQGIGVSRNKT
jgi:hypothetical protein